MRRLRRAVRNSLNALHESCRRLEESEGCHARKPLAAIRYLQNANFSLRRAAQHLGRASVRMNDALDALARAPHEGERIEGIVHPYRGASEVLRGAAEREVRVLQIADCGERLARVTALGFLDPAAGLDRKAHV